MIVCIHHWKLGSDNQGACCKCGMTYGLPQQEIANESQQRKIRKIHKLIETLNKDPAIDNEGKSEIRKILEGIL